MHDIIIAGAGPAGLTAALYACRAGKKVLIFEKETFGGQITFSPKVENYPGFIEMSGNEFAEKLIEQVIAIGAEIELAEVEKIEKNDDAFRVITDGGEYDARAVIIAAGSKHRRLGIAREGEFVGHGVSYCAVCDGAFFKGKTVAVIGGGNTALQEAVMLSDICERVYVVQNLDFLTGEEKLAEILSIKPNVEIILGVVVDELVGGKDLSAIKIKNEKSGEISEITLDGIFVAIGQEPENKPFENIVKLNDYGYIAADENCTVDDGIYVAGDCRGKSVRQITTATGDGATAAICACRYLER